MGAHVVPRGRPQRSFTTSELVLLNQWLAEGVPLREISRRLDIPKTSLLRILDRGRLNAYGGLVPKPRL